VVVELALARLPRVFQFHRAEVGPIGRTSISTQCVPKSVLPVAGFVLQQSSSADDGLDRTGCACDRRRSAPRLRLQWFSLSALLGVIVLGLSWRLLRAGPPRRRGVNAITVQ